MSCRGCAGAYFQVRSLDLISSERVLHSGSSVRASVVTSGRTFVRIRLELIQGAQANEIIDDRVSVVYCDFPMSWNKRTERSEVLEYCAGLESFLLENLWEEAILIAAYPVSHTLE